MWYRSVSNESSLRGINFSAGAGAGGLLDNLIQRIRRKRHRTGLARRRRPLRQLTQKLTIATTVTGRQKSPSGLAAIPLSMSSQRFVAPTTCATDCRPLLLRRSSACSCSALGLHVARPKPHEALGVPKWSRSGPAYCPAGPGDGTSPVRLIRHCTGMGKSRVATLHRKFVHALSPERL